MAASGVQAGAGLGRVKNEAPLSLRSPQVQSISSVPATGFGLCVDTTLPLQASACLGGGALQRVRSLMDDQLP